MIVTTFPKTVRVIEHTLIPLKDGTRLAARIWLPDDAEKNIHAALRYIQARYGAPDVDTSTLEV